MAKTKPNPAQPIDKKTKKDLDSSLAITIGKASINPGQKLSKEDLEGHLLSIDSFLSEILSKIFREGKELDGRENTDQENRQINSANIDKYREYVRSLGGYKGELVKTYAQQCTENKKPIDLEGLLLQCGIFKDLILTNANLNTADCTEADFEGANLANASMLSTTFTNANLSNALLKEANCTGANFTGAKCTGTNFEKATLTDAIISKTTSVKNANFLKITANEELKGTLLDIGASLQDDKAHYTTGENRIVALTPSAPPMVEEEEQSKQPTPYQPPYSAQYVTQAHNPYYQEAEYGQHVPLYPATQGGYPQPLGHGYGQHSQYYPPSTAGGYGGSSSSPAPSTSYMQAGHGGAYPQPYGGQGYHTWYQQHSTVYPQQQYNAPNAAGSYPPPTGYGQPASYYTAAQGGGYPPPPSEGYGQAVQPLRQGLRPRALGQERSQTLTEQTAGQPAPELHSTSSSSLRGRLSSAVRNLANRGKR